MKKAENFRDHLYMHLMKNYCYRFGIENCERSRIEKGIEDFKPVLQTYHDILHLPELIPTLLFDLHKRYTPLPFFSLAEPLESDKFPSTQIQSLQKSVDGMASAFFCRETLLYWLTNLVAAFFLSAAHNVLYFVLDIRTPVLHFLHHFLTFVFLSYHTFVLKRWPQKKRIPKLSGVVPSVFPAVILQLICTILSSRIHSQNRTGSLYLLRISDFLITITVLLLSSKMKGISQSRPYWSHTLPIALSASLSWLEFSHIEYDGMAMFLSPMHGILQGLHLVLLNRAYHITSSVVDLESFSLIYTGMVSAFLSLPALVSYKLSVISYDASWESIDYVMMGMSLIYMAVFKYSELWLLTQTDLRTYCILEHSKYFLASCGQWFLQNMAHATVYALCGKLLFLGSLCRYWGYIRTRL
ncbi:unnamed protein product [Bursaphelenchus xylophilus]|uniref:(pine wood nematode) hypothetical protein n=1 Tax=Bursaphelenchus xylophilus TaxID=6326 RepID=A0A1I7S8V8_BURXY|nr:unnamed protein product [Bursaphelenchus xylophilus]CAG9085920.1 unnamed protein product [Bursaphelenchus xylophilus]